MKKILKNPKNIIIIVVIIIATCGYFLYERKDNISEEQEELEIPKENEVKKEAKEKNIIVHISGEVIKGGVYELQDGARIKDIIDKAGGITKNAYMEEINLAQPLEDGMKIIIPNKQKIENKNENLNKTANQKETEKVNSKININNATQKELETLPGIGETTAKKIIQYRKEKGKFKSVDEIKEIKGIGENKFNKIKNFIKT